MTLARSSLARIPFIRNLFLATLVAVLAVPGYLIGVVQPSFEQALVRITEEEAVRAARQLSRIVARATDEINRQALTEPTLRATLNEMGDELGLFKLRLFSPAGEILFSSAAEEIGRINDKPYFHQVVARGERFTKLVQKSQPSAEGTPIDLDVVETYVPIMRDGVFHGALEVYYDISARMGEQERRLFHTSVVMSLLGLALMGFVVAVLRRAGASFREQQRGREIIADLGRQRAQLLNSLGEGVYGVDRDGNTTFINPAALEMLGRGAEEILGRGLHELVHHTHPDGRHYPVEACPVQQTLRDGTTRKVGDELFWRKDGSSFPVEYHSAPLIDETGALKGAVVVFRDVTAQREGAAALERAKALAERANRAKSEFVANMSHEIRTPMNAVTGMSHLLTETGLDEQQRDYVNKIQASSQHLLGIINDILDFSKIEAKKLDIEHTTFRLGEVMDNLANLAVVLGEGRDVEVLLALDPALPEVVVGDSLRLGQVMINLVSNAIKFTEHGEVVVEVGTAEPLDGPVSADEVVLRVAVRDNGIGMDEAQLSRLFTPFTQADGSTTRRFGGTGLGLSISRSLVEMMGGEISATSEPGRGSTFTFTCRLGLGAEARSEPTVPGEGLAGLRVLVVDDNPSARDILSGCLRRWGVETALATSAAEGLEALREAFAEGAHPYDVVLMDWAMPGMDGIEACRRIKSGQGRLGDPAVVMVTAHGREEILKRAREVGGDGYLLKPITPTALHDTLVRVAGRDAGPGGGTGAVGDVEARPASLAGMRLLLAEDNLINQQVAREILERAGAEVVVAVDGVETVAHFEARPEGFDAVLMDVQMPEMDGYEATAAIRRLEKRGGGARLPIIAMTANAMSGDRERCLEAGMDDHVAKPVDVRLLLTTLARWCGVEAVTVAGGERSLIEGLPATLPGIDMAKLGERLGGNATLARQLLNQFRIDNARIVEVIRMALSDGDRDMARRLTHTLKGVGGNLAAAEVHAAALALEQAIDRGDGVLDEPLSALERAVAEVVEAAGLAADTVTEEASPTEAGAVAEMDERLVESLRELDAMLEANDFNATTRYQELRPALAALAEAAELESVDGMFTRLDFPAAREALQGIAGGMEGAAGR